MSLNIEQVRAQFPSLKDGTHYLDSAASSLTPTCVIDAMDEYYREYRANVHRGLYASAERASEMYESARKKVAGFIGAHPEEIIFTNGATGSANMLVYALEHTYGFTPGDEIVMTVAEHHALLVPLQELAKRNGMIVKYAQLTKDFMLDEGDLRELITDKTRIVAVMGASNVTGSIFDVETNTRRAGTHTEETAPGARPWSKSLPSAHLNADTKPIIIRDITALVGHAPMNVAQIGADFAFFSGHKMCGPTGVGVLWGKKEQLAKLQPGFFGGGMISEVTFEGARYQDTTERFEPGTPNIAGVIGFGAAVSYLETVGLENTHAHVRELVAYAQEQLASIPGVTLYSASPEHNVGTISFTVEGTCPATKFCGIHPHDVAQICADNGVAVRPGHHCAMPLHIALGITATTRASFYLYNSKEDVDALVEAVKKAQSLFA